MVSLFIFTTTSNVTTKLQPPEKKHGPVPSYQYNLILISQKNKPLTPS